MAIVDSGSLSSYLSLGWQTLPFMLWGVTRHLFQTVKGNMCSKSFELIECVQYKTVHL